MAITQQELDGFTAFVSEQLDNGGGDLSFEEIARRVAREEPSSHQQRDDLRAAKASLRDMKAGEKGRPR